MTTAKAHSSKGHKKHISHVRIEKGTNGGFVVHTHYREPEQKRGGPYMPPPEPDMAPFTDQAGMMGHIGKLFGNPGGAPAGGGAQQQPQPLED